MAVVDRVRGDLGDFGNDINIAIDKMSGTHVPDELLVAWGGGGNDWIEPS